MRHEIAYSRVCNWWNYWRCHLCDHPPHGYDQPPRPCDHPPRPYGHPPAQPFVYAGPWCSLGCLVRHPRRQRWLVGRLDGCVFRNGQRRKECWRHRDGRWSCRFRFLRLDLCQSPTYLAIMLVGWPRQDNAGPMLPHRPLINAGLNATDFQIALPCLKPFMGQISKCSRNNQRVEGETDLRNFILTET